MSSNSQAFANIEVDFDKFCRAVEEALRDRFDVAKRETAFWALRSLRDRYLSERHGLQNFERGPLYKLFEEDCFIRGCCQVATVSLHSKKDQPYVVHGPDGVRRDYDPGSSAFSWFPPHSSSPVVHVTDCYGNTESHDLSEWLNQAHRRVTKAMDEVKR